MSRIGNKPILIPSGVQVDIQGNNIKAKGPLGELSLEFKDIINVTVESDNIICKRKNDQPESRSMHGLYRSLISNIIEGVTSGFEIKLEVVGTGYRIEKKGDNLVFNLGYSHPINVEPLGTNKLDVEGQNLAIVKGIDRQLVGQQASDIKKLRKPNPYTGKGVKYQGETITRKAGKAAVTTA
ncbi:MAG: 50S ribosomal protein L6 [Chloroflexi bacterium]|nr:50S ribosomal protein L6 [Chloroflexota bacterium]|tara:strand:- start:1060 stop:1605 length:546 start_codon:yes stop_codon:yes gene_type:complete